MTRAAAATLLEVILETGRKHQIRVHLAQTGHPLLGDRRYSEDRAGPIGRLALHAVSLEIEHPTTGRRERFESQPPQAFLTPFR
jgi:23S rRNA pseudouridine1911/1915/1917 synthase